MYTSQVVFTSVLCSNKLGLHAEVSNSAQAVGIGKLLTFTQSFLQPLSCTFADVGNAGQTA